MGDGDVNPLDIKFQKRFTTNLISNIIYFILNLLIGLAIVPFFLDSLGEAAYGLIPLATSLTSYVTIVINVLNASISRYLTIDLQKSDVERANETFNTAICGSLAVVIALIPVIIVVSLIAPYFFNIGEESVTSVFWLFALILASVVIRAWSSNFMVTLFAYNRLDLRNYVNIAYILIQVVLVIFLFTILHPSLEFVGFSYLAASVFALLLSYILSRKTCPFLKINAQYFSRKRFFEISGMSVWVLFTYMGGLLNASIGQMMANKLFGEIAGTEYSLAFMWYTLLIGIASLLTTVFTPMIYSYYSRNDREGLLRFTKLSIRCVGFGMALLVSLISIFAPQLLTIWIGEEYVRIAPLVCLLIIPVLLRTQADCVSPIFMAYRKVRVPAIANLSIGILNISLCLIFASYLNIGIYGIALSLIITSIVSNFIVDALYNAHIIHAPKFTFMVSMFYGVIAYVILLIIGNMYTTIIPIDSFGMIIISGFTLSLPYGIIVLRFCFKKEERNLIRECLPKRIQPLIPTWIL